MGVTELEVTNVLLGLISGLIGILIWVAKTFAENILHELRKLDRRMAECIGQFADDADNRTAHSKIFDKLDNHEGRIAKVEALTDGDAGK